MGLKPLEFEDCILDSPYFRENIHEHERELERTNEAIKRLIKECKALLKAIESRYSRSLQFDPYYTAWYLLYVLGSRCRFLSKCQFSSKRQPKVHTLLFFEANFSPKGHGDFLQLAPRNFNINV